MKPSAEYYQCNDELNDIRNKLSNLLDKSLRETKYLIKLYRALDTFSLCIVPGILVWKIVIDINIINNDGNLYDACMLSCLASWQSFK